MSDASRVQGYRAPRAHTFSLRLWLMTTSAGSFYDVVVEHHHHRPRRNSKAPCNNVFMRRDRDIYPNNKQLVNSDGGGFARDGPLSGRSPLARSSARTILNTNGNHHHRQQHRQHDDSDDDDQVCCLPILSRRDASSTLFKKSRKDKNNGGAGGPMRELFDDAHPHLPQRSRQGEFGARHHPNKCLTFVPVVKNLAFIRPQAKSFQMPDTCNGGGGGGGGDLLEELSAIGIGRYVVVVEKENSWRM